MFNQLAQTANDVSHIADWKVIAAAASFGSGVTWAIVSAVKRNPLSSCIKKLCEHDNKIGELQMKTVSLDDTGKHLKLSVNDLKDSIKEDFGRVEKNLADIIKILVDRGKK